MFLVRLFFELLSDSEQADADILGRDSDYLANLIVAEVFEPQQYDGAVKGLQLGNAAMK
jgi:hypothetical protein